MEGPSSQQTSQRSAKQLPECKLPKPFVKMEDRAKARKDGRDQLKKTYEEKYKKAEEERKAIDVKKEEERHKKIQDDNNHKR